MNSIQSGLLCLICLIACKTNSNPTDNQTKTIEQSISTQNIDSQDRTIWQKPVLVLELLGDISDKVIADIGAGTGYFSFRFIHNAKKVIAIEIDKSLIEMMNAEKSYNSQLLQNKFEARLATENDPALNEQEIDIAFLSNTYTYIPKRVEYLTNLRKKFKENGRIMIIDFKKKLTPIGPDQNQRMAQSDIEQELISAGYHIVLSDDSTLQYQYIIIAVIGDK